MDYYIIKIEFYEGKRESFSFINSHDDLVTMNFADWNIFRKLNNLKFAATHEDFCKDYLFDAKTDILYVKLIPK